VPVAVDDDVIMDRNAERLCDVERGSRWAHKRTSTQSTAARTSWVSVRWRRLAGELRL
jgi:hypothetical protein